MFEREPNVPPFLDLDADNSSGAVGSNFSTVLSAKKTSLPAVDSDALLTDNSSDNLFSLVARIANLRDGEAETLTADTSGTSIAATYNAETGELTLAGFDTPANYQRVLRSITYSNTAVNRNASPRTITFVANDGSLTSNTAVTTIVYAPPNTRPIAHAGGPYSIQFGGSLLLNASQSVDPDSGPKPLTFEWDVNYVGGVFDVNATGRSASITWSEMQLAGIESGKTYTVAVRAFDGEDTSIATTQLTVSPNQPPIVLTGGPYAIQPGWTLFLNSTGSFDPERGPSVLSVEWDVDFEGEFAADATGHTAPLSWSRLQQLGIKPGKTYPIAVRATDGEETTQRTTQVTVFGNQRPSAAIDGPYSLQPGWTLFMRAIGSFDPDFGPEPLTYEWDINFDGKFKADVTGQIVAVHWSTLQQLGVEPGKSYSIVLRVYDGADQTFAFTSLTVSGSAVLGNGASAADFILGQDEGDLFDGLV